MNFPPQKLKEILTKEGLVKAPEFDLLLEESVRLNQKIEDILVSRGIISTGYFFNILSEYLGVDRSNLANQAIDEKALNLLSPDLAKQKKSIIFKKEEDGTLDVAMEDPSDLRVIEFLEKHLKARVRPFLASPEDLEKGFSIYNKNLTENFKKIIEENIKSSLHLKEEKIEQIAKTVPIVAIVETFISYAVSLSASDIHIEVLEDIILVRFRIDGILHEIIRMPKEVHPSILARIKLISNLKIDEHYRPQDGRFHFKAGEDDMDVRVAIMPTLYGEKIEMRLLPATQKPLSLEEVGISSEMVEVIKENIKKSFGMVLVCGPTGSGKTTTLYSILNILNKPEINIVTIEDPIEYYIKYINQTQINSQAGVTFANALRAFLRQDPNVILVGEIRDKETAEISINAALTGHLLLSSLHTNSAIAAIPRLLDLKVPSFLMAAVLNLIVAQRLVRKICLNCIESVSPTKEVLEALERQKKEDILYNVASGPKTLFRGKGCSVCNFTGYKGRMGIFEILNIDNEMRDFIAKPDFSIEILKDMAKEKGFASMLEDGIRKSELGLTTIEEVLRVIRE